MQLVDTWQILVKNIEKQLSGFSDICMALLMFFCILGELEMELLGMSILILLMILIKEDLYTGYVFTISGFAISWKYTLQTTVALSTIEAEYMAIKKACKEAIWLKGLFGELSENLQITIVFCDSQSAIFLTKD